MADGSTMKQTPDPKIGRKIGPYVVREKIASGGMGVVYKAYEASLDRIVALKLLPGHMLADPKFRERFLQEARSAAKLEHAGIVPVYSAGEDGDDLFIAMQYVRGKTFADIMDEDGIVPTRTALEITRAAAAALDFAHQRGMVHRDMKPDNVMIDEDGNVKIMDFGLAKMQFVSGGLTQSGLYLGTPEYSSPEQCETNNLDGRSDIYSLGVVLYEALSGALPHTAETPLALFHKVTKEPATPLRVLNSKVPATVEALVAKMMAKNAADRYKTAADVVRQIDKILEVERFVEQPGSKVVVPRHRKITPGGSPETDDSKTIAVRYDRDGNAYAPTQLPKIVAAAVLLLGLAVAGMIYTKFQGGSTTDEGDITTAPIDDPATVNVKGDAIPADVAGNMRPKRIAVLSFENWAKDPRMDWIALGMQEMITNSLSGSEFVEVVSRAEVMRTWEEVVASHGDVVAYNDTIVRSLAKRLNVDLVISGHFVQDAEELRVDVLLDDLNGFEFRKDFTGSKERMIRLVNTMADELRASIEDYIVEEARAVAEKLAAERAKDSNLYGAADNEWAGPEGAQHAGSDALAAGQRTLSLCKAVWPEESAKVRSYLNRLDIHVEGIEDDELQDLLNAACDKLPEQLNSIAVQVENGTLRIKGLDDAGLAFTQPGAFRERGRQRRAQDMNLNNMRVVRAYDANEAQLGEASQGENQDAVELSIVCLADDFEEQSKKEPSESRTALEDEEVDSVEHLKQSPDTAPRSQAMAGFKKLDEKKRELAETMKSAGFGDDTIVILTYMQALNRRCNTQFARETCREFLASYAGMTEEDRQNEAVQLLFRAQSMLEEMGDELSMVKVESALGLAYRAYLYHPQLRNLAALIGKLENARLELDFEAAVPAEEESEK